MSGQLHIYTPDGTHTAMPISTKRPALEVMQEAVGGLIVPVKVRYAGRIREAYVNDEGLIYNMCVNLLAMKFAKDALPDNSAVPLLVGNMCIWIPDPKGKK